MGTYKNYKCGNCGTSLTNGYQRAGAIDNFTRCGSEFLHCYKCGQDSKTGFIPFNKMHLLEKIWVYIILITSSILFAIFIPFVGLAIVNVLLGTINKSWGISWDIITKISLYLAPLSTGIVIYYQFRSFKKLTQDGTY